MTPEELERLAREAGADTGAVFNVDRAWLARFAALVRAQALADAAKWCATVQAHHAAKTGADAEEQAFFEGEACGAEDCVESINANGQWP